MKKYLIGLIIFSSVGFFVAYIYGVVAFAIVYSLGAIIYKLDKIEAKLDEMNKINE